jgi:polyphosphate kinase
MIDRELSLLAFNRRVLAQATRADVPLLERLRYVTIVSSNLDEFFEVRFPDYLEIVRSTTDETARSTFATVSREAHDLIDEQYRVLNEQVMPALAEHGIRILNHAERNAPQRRWVASFFESQVRPLLVPVALDPAHPFPLVANKSLNFILRLTGDDVHATGSAVVIVKVPRSLPRVIRLPDRLMPPGEQGFALLTSVIRAHLDDLLPGRRVQSFSQFRVTRDSDLDVDEDGIQNLRQALRSGLTTRQYGQAIRLEVVSTCPPELWTLLLQQFALPEPALYRVNGPVNLVRLTELIDQVEAPALRFPPFQPGWPARDLPRDAPIIARLKRGDVLLHHPFQSFEPVVEFLRQAVEDPQVLAIRQTVYRTGNQSVVMDLLMEAVRRGKEVTVVLELKARFDEEANINWAERLEGVGAQVVYGMVGLKTHAKMLLVTRREPQRGRGAHVLRRYAHLSTGNYNPRTARLYTDVSLLSADPALTADVEAVFLTLSSLAAPRGLRRLLTAPDQLHAAMLHLLRRVAQAAQAGRPARVVLKFNTLTDPALVDGLVEASRAGVPIDLIVRGACTLRPGVPGQTETVRVRSVVGRFLEHSRVFYFRWGPTDDDEALYLSSADWMSRNMLRRVEVAWPLNDAALRQRVIDECLVPYLHDRLDAWDLCADGSYTRADPAAADGASAQQALMHLHGRLEQPLRDGPDPLASR